MKKKMAMVGAFLVVFVAGYMAGGIHTRYSIALELGGVSKTLDSLKSLGTTIVEMQKNVDELQQNIEDVKKVKEDITSYQGLYEGAAGVGTEEGNQKLKEGATKGLLDYMTAPKEETPAK